jgi:hypothetical protein
MKPFTLTEQRLYIARNDYWLKVTKMSFTHKLNPISDNDSIICIWHPTVTAHYLKPIVSKPIVCEHYT